MNILEMCLSPDYGGLEIHMRDFSRFLAAQPEVRLFLALQKGTRLETALRPLPAACFLMTGRAGKFPLIRAKGLSRFIESNRIGVVHVHWKFDLPLAALSKQLTNFPFVLIHTRSMSLPGGKHDPYHHFLYKKIDAFIAITRYLAGQAVRNLPLPAQRIHVIPYGVNPTPTSCRGRPRPPCRGRPAASSPGQLQHLKRKFFIGDNPAVGMIGRISEAKGQHLFVEALAKLKAEGLPFQAVIAGEPFEHHYFQRLRAMIEKEGFQEQVRLIDFLENPYDLMRCLDVLVLASKRETFGLVLIEAMHCGVAVIASNAGGVPEIVENEVNGLLFESGDSQALATAMRRLIVDVPLRRRLAAQGQEIARRRFDAQRQFGAVLELMKNLSHN